MNFLYAICASVLVSVISLIGIFTLLLKEKVLDKILLLLVGFGAGGLIGGAFLHLLPEALADAKECTTPFIYVIIGFVFFFVMERFLYWHHCHDGKCDVHIFTYLNLMGGGIHNLIDGLIIGTSFCADIKLGMVATLAIIAHEIPQELGDFGILVYGGFSKFKALLWNFLTALTAVLGTIMGYFFASRIAAFSNIFLLIAAGGFIYIAACDLIPELHKQPDMKKSLISVIFFLFGILLMLVLKLIWG